MMDSTKVCEAESPDEQGVLASTTTPHPSSGHVEPPRSFKVSNGSDSDADQDIEKKKIVDDDDDSFLGPSPWKPSGNFWKDAWFFVGPGWLVSIAYVDPGNYQADIQAGSSRKYTLLFAVWWSSMLSIYVQRLCVRLAFCSQLTLAEAQARDAKNTFFRYLSWGIAEFSSMITDLPEVIGFGIACHYFFGWPYYIGVLLSLLTTMIFLATLRYGIQILELIILFFVGIMSIALWVEMAVVGPDMRELMKGWTIGFVDVTSQDLFRIAGILGAVVMPHNLYLHTAAIQSRRVERKEEVVMKAVKYCSWEPVLPILVSFFVNVAVVTIAAESVYGTPNAEEVGLTDFCTYFQSLKGGCLLWGIALLAAGQSSAITTTFTGQYVMDGFLNIRLPFEVRAFMTRLLAILPCVVVSILFPDSLNDMVNMVNSSLSLFLPFAFCPLVKYNCSERIMGRKFVSRGIEKVVLYTFAIAVWLINAIALSTPGGGYFGEFVPQMEWSWKKGLWIILQILLQAFYAWWNIGTLFSPVRFDPLPLEEARPLDEQFAKSSS